MIQKSLNILTVFLFICLSANTQGKVLLALSKGDHVLAIVDPETLKIKSRISVSPDPHEVIASADGKTAYVSISYSGNGREIDVIDLRSRKRLENINTKALLNPHGLDLHDGKVYFSAEGSKAIARYDPILRDIDWIMGTGEDRTHMVKVSKDGKTIFTTNVNAGTVSILQDTSKLQSVGPMPSPSGSSTSSNTIPSIPQSIWTHTTVSASKGIEGFDVTTDEKELWTVSAIDGTIHIIDIISKKVIGKLNVEARGANRLKFSNDGKLAMISSLRNGELIIVDVAKRELIKKIQLGKGCAGILADPDASRVFVACTPDNYIAVVDLNTFTITGKIELAKPDGLAWAIQ